MSVLRLKPADDGCFFYHRTADPRCSFYNSSPPKESDYDDDDGIAGAIVNRDSAGDTDVASESESEAMR